MTIMLTATPLAAMAWVLRRRWWGNLADTVGMVPAGLALGAGVVCAAGALLGSQEHSSGFADWRDSMPRPRWQSRSVYIAQVAGLGCAALMSVLAVMAACTMMRADAVLDVPWASWLIPLQAMLVMVAAAAAGELLGSRFDRRYCVPIALILPYLIHLAVAWVGPLSSLAGILVEPSPEGLVPEGVAQALIRTSLWASLSVALVAFALRSRAGILAGTWGVIFGAAVMMFIGSAPPATPDDAEVCRGQSFTVCVVPGRAMILREFEETLRPANRALPPLLRIDRVRPETVGQAMAGELLLSPSDGFDTETTTLDSQQVLGQFLDGALTSRCRDLGSSEAVSEGERDDGAVLQLWARLRAGLPTDRALYPGDRDWGSLPSDAPERSAAADLARRTDAEQELVIAQSLPSIDACRPRLQV